MRKQRYLKLFVAGMSIEIFALGLVSAAATSADISHSYHTVNNIVAGSIVSLDSQKSNYVQPANINNSSRAIGVVVASNSSLIALDPTAGNIQVAISGEVNTLVSTVNGDINIGDQIAVSPFNGVGMKALPGSRIIGLSQSKLNSSTQGITTQEVTNKEGNKNRIQVGYVRVSIATGINTAGSENSGLNVFQKLAQSIAGHPVSTIRIVLSVIVALFALVSLTVLIYASIHGSIIAIGRNPLAKYSIFRTLGSTLAMAAITASLASVAIFALIR